MRARVYKNLNKGGLWSIKQQCEGKWVVVGHATSVALNNVTPYISDARHDHVRSGEYREVFAWLEGDLCWAKDFVSYKGREIWTVDCFPLRPFNRTEYLTFRPFSEVKRGFFYPESDEDFAGASCAYFTENQGVWAQ